MHAEIIAVGTELLLGQIVNTNAAFISNKLAECGIGMYYQTVVGDNAERIKEVFHSALQRADLIIFTGGLGPTMDDLTKETVAQTLGKKLIKSTFWEKKMKDFFTSIGKEMSENNLKQAFFLEGSEILVNKNGTAPGIFLKDEGKTIIMLPGPPRELQPMFTEEVLPRLRKYGSCSIIKSRVLKAVGLGEASLENCLHEIIKSQTNPTIAPLAKEIEVHIRITAQAQDDATAENMLTMKEEEIRAQIGSYIYGVDEQTMEEKVAFLLSKGNLTLSVAESITGGLVTHRLTEIPGSSKFLHLGVTAYSGAAKQKLLDVNRDVLEQEGEVSEAAACSMATGVKNLLDTDYGLSITGIAGPTGATPHKPVGLVYIAIAWKNKTQCQQFNFTGKRKTIKRRATISALNLLRIHLLEEGGT